MGFWFFLIKSYQVPFEQYKEQKEARLWPFIPQLVELLQGEFE